MRLRIPRPRQFGSTLRDLARRDPDEAEAYLDTHQEAWEELAERNPHDAADILEALAEEGAAEGCLPSTNTPSNGNKTLSFINSVKQVVECLLVMRTQEEVSFIRC